MTQNKTKLSFSLPKVAKMSKFHFVKCLKKWYHVKVFKRFYLNGHPIGFRQQIQKLKTLYKTVSLWK